MYSFKEVLCIVSITVMIVVVLMEFIQYKQVKKLKKEKEDESTVLRDIIRGVFNSFNISQNLFFELMCLTKECQNKEVNLHPYWRAVNLMESDSNGYVCEMENATDIEVLKTNKRALYDVIASRNSMLREAKNAIEDMQNINSTTGNGEEAQ